MSDDLTDIPEAPPGYPTANPAAVHRARTDDGLRLRLVRALWRRDDDLPTPHAQIGGYVYEIADKAAAVMQPHLDQLRRQVQGYRGMKDTYLRERNAAHTELIKAEEIITGLCDNLERHPVIKAAIDEQRERADRAEAELAKAREDLATAVWIDPERCGGQPCIGGTRIPVRLVAELAADGDDAALTAYPSLTPAQVAVARWYAERYGNVEQNRAAVERVRALRDELAQPGRPLAVRVVADRITAALNPDQPEETAPAGHTGGNAEDCPACTGRRDLPYPFICPGTDQPKDTP